MLVTVNTKSNFKNLNDKWLLVEESNGTRITCKVFSKEFKKFILIDFTLSEVTGITDTKEQSIIDEAYLVTV